MMDTFGARLRSARLSAALSQRQLALGIMSTSQLSLLERDQRRPSVETLTALAERLDTSTHELCGGLRVVGRARPECRLEQAERALHLRHFATAERLAMQVIYSATNAERRMRALCVRADAREALGCAESALQDLGQALEIAHLRRDQIAVVRIALNSARLRLLCHSDDAA